MKNRYEAPSGPELFQDSCDPERLDKNRLLGHPYSYNWIKLNDT